MKIVIETIPHDQHRYPTCGDWFYDPDGTLHIKVSELGDWREEALIQVHELIEVLLCKHRGITQEQVDEFDTAFEKARKDSEAEPGDSSLAPYRREHCTATAVERLLCAELDVCWENYEKKIQSLP